MKNGKKQAKDIPDREVLAAVDVLSKAEPERWVYTPHWVMAWDLEKALGLEDTGRLLLAKCESLIRRELMSGCTCGCRGDFELTAKGRAILEVAQSTESA